MDVRITMYPAKNGDCFLISYGNKQEQQKHLLIDCGYADTVKNYLKEDLIKIGKRGEVLEKVILTHIDADHIQGAIKLLEDNNSEKFIEINEIWHNTFRHLFDRDENNIDKKQERILRQIIQRGYQENEKGKEKDYTISAEQGTTVGALILRGKYPWNSDFDNNAASIDSQREIIVDENTKIFLLSPDKQKLEKLRNLWKDELRKYGINYEHGNSQIYDDAFEMLMSWEKEKSNRLPKEISAANETVDRLLTRQFDEDDTTTNGSSIAFILHIQDRRLLFLADAHPDLVTKSLKEYQKEGIVIFDLVKIAHHGSFSNINSELLEKIDAPRYLISTNGGKHNHPDKETIAHIVSRKADFHRRIYFNYVTNNSKYFDREDWKEKYNYSIHYLNQAPYTLSL